MKVSGRKGLGVKADDLLDALVAKARAEVDARDPGRDVAGREATATAVATGALRYFMMRCGRTRIITFDMEEALAFTGETGPYVQNAVVRARNIFGKMEAEGHRVADLLARARGLDLVALLSGEEGDEVIVPGPRLMVAWLLSGTSDLATFRATSPPGGASAFADKTRDAMERGCRVAIAGWIERCVRDAARSVETQPRLLLTGGALPEVLPYLGIAGEEVPDLVLRGLAELAGPVPI